MQHLTCGTSSLLHSVNLILFTLLLVHLILCISPHHFTTFALTICHSLDLSLQTKNLSVFANPLLHSHSYISFRTDFTDLNLYCIKGALAFSCFSFFFLYFVLLRVIDGKRQCGKYVW